MEFTSRLKHLWQRASGSPGRRLLVPLGAALALVWGFAELASEIVEGETRAVDEWVLRAMRTSDLADPVGPPWFEDMARDATALGGNVVIGVLLLAVTSWLALHRRYREAVFLVASIGIGLGVLFLLKLGFDRPRPELVPHGQEVFTASFPSGHSMTATMTYLTLAALLARMERRTREQVFPIAVALFVSFLVGLSRVYLGVHYPTDVLGGWALGTAWAVLSWLVADWLLQGSKA